MRGGEGTGGEAACPVPLWKMIERYTTPEMNAIWSRQAKYEKWKEVEVAIVEAHAELGAVPAEAAAIVRSRATFCLDRCDELERETRHDLMAFVRNLSENIGEEGRYVGFLGE